MEWLFICGLIAWLMALIGRLKTAERRIAQVEDMQTLLFERLRATERQPVIEDPAPAAHAEAPPAVRAPPVRVRASVPKVRPRDDDGVAETLSAPIEPPVQQIDPEPVAADEGTFAPRTFRIDFEDIFGRRLPIWAGGVALAVAGVFLVRYSIERGLITPMLRVIMAFVFGFGLLAAAEAAYRLRERIADPRVGQALAGAGLATLYAAFYLAGTQYGLIGQTLAFIGLAAVTAGAIALSFRFGLPSAVLGLVGGFAAPVLVGGEEANLPLLSLYLGLVTAGLVLSGRSQQRPWMGISALVGGLGWGAMLLLAGEFGPAEMIALGLYFIVLGTALPALVGTPQFERPLRLGAALVASVQLALLVDEAGYAPLVWTLYLLLGASLAFFGWRRPDIREGNAIAAAVALILLAQWEGAPVLMFAAVGGGIAAIFALVPLALIWRGDDRPIDAWQVAGTAATLATVSYASFGDYAADRIEALMALAVLTLAALPAGAAWFARARETASILAIQLATSAALIFGALLLLTPVWAAPLAGAAVFAGLYGLLGPRIETPLHALVWSAAVVVGLALTAHLRIDQEVEHLFGGTADNLGALSLLRWLALAAVLAALAWRERVNDLRQLAEGAAALFVYGTLAQVLPRDTLAWTAAVLAIGLHFSLPQRRAAQLAALALAAAWAIEPVGRWLQAGAESLVGDPVFVTELPALQALATRVLPILAALSVVRLPLPRKFGGAAPGAALGLAVGLVAAHVLFKQVFAIGSMDRFISLGLAERILWEALLLGGAWLAAYRLPWTGARRRFAAALAAAALAHFAFYTGLLHNPLWDQQALGTLPFVNLALAAYGVAIGTALSLRRWANTRLAPATDWASIALTCLAVLTLLRHAFAGSLPSLVPMSQTEDLLRSLAGILLALGFLWLGSRRDERSWRLGSLAIMLVAVAKVFLVDAAGLDGLLRVASFMALGFSLIGIGWIYARQLRTRPAAE